MELSKYGHEQGGIKKVGSKKCECRWRFLNKIVKLKECYGYEFKIWMVMKKYEWRWMETSK